ncbi:hypothetical protein NDA16_001453 [Ustilago loliicola]|nr:hypothetical protein NDA16_001453 [Ustilago loliicola]
MSTPSTPYKVIHTTEAPGALAPYSQAVVHNGVVYVSGCIPFTTEMKLVEGGIVEQTEQAMTNLFAVVKAAGSDPSRFAPYKPARSAVEVARLPKDVGVEIECIAAVKSNL